MPKFRSSVPPETVKAIARDLVPLVLDANADSSEALSSRPDRYSEASMGYITWDHSRRAIWEELRKSPDWRITNTENDLVLTCLAGPEDLRLRLCRVDPNTRLPTSGKRAKQNAYQRPLLSDELHQLVYHPHEFLVGYDTGIFSGVGKITLQLLWASSEAVYSETIAVLYDATIHDTKPMPAPQESIPKGIPSRRQAQPNSEPVVGGK